VPFDCNDKDTFAADPSAEMVRAAPAALVPNVRSVRNAASPEPFHPAPALAVPSSIAVVHDNCRRCENAVSKVSDKKMVRYIRFIFIGIENLSGKSIS